MSKLKHKLKSVPAKPGVYFFKNKTGKIIYIGKALSLKHRVKSYFAKNIRDGKTKLLVSEIVDFDYQLVPSEFEALLLEAKLIKDHKPKYNVRLMDSKSYLYIAISKNPYRVFSLRQTELKNDLANWYGPFPSGRDVRQVLRTIRRVFPYCNCKKPPTRQCLYSHIELCPGFQNLNSPQYKQNIKQIQNILAGKTKLLIKSIEKKMKLSAKNLDFEKAEKYKKQFLSLQYVTTSWKNIPTEDLSVSKALIKLQKLLVKHQGIDPTTISKIEGYDVSNLGKQIIVGAMVAFTNGQPDKSMYRKFKINFAGLKPDYRQKLNQQNDPGAIYQIISRRLNHPEWIYPQLILVDGGKGQVSAAFDALKKFNLAGKICLFGLSKPARNGSALGRQEETIVIPKISQNKIISWKLLQYSPRSEVRKLLQRVRDESHRFAQSYYKYLHHQKTIA